MRRIRAFAGSLLFFVVAPGSVAGLIPWAITGGRWTPGPLWLRGAGAGLMLLGAIPLVESFVRFALKGQGTPAPVAPPRHLVVSGFYRYMRNPMYTGVGAILAGEAMLLADVRLGLYAAGVWAAMHLFVVFYEERTLKRSFGARYETFCAHVPRWLPRLTAWNG